MKSSGNSIKAEQEKTKLENGSCMLTTHRVIYITEDNTVGLEFPLHYVVAVKKESGFFTTSQIQLSIGNQGTYPAYVEDYFHNVLRSPNLPQKPKYGSQVYVIKFGDKKVMENFHKLLEEALKAQIWCKPIMTESRKQAELMQQNQISTSAAGGLGAIIKHNESKQEQSKNMI